jgi:hypothetical protein
LVGSIIDLWGKAVQYSFLVIRTFPFFAFRSPACAKPLFRYGEGRPRGGHLLSGQKRTEKPPGLRGLKPNVEPPIGISMPAAPPSPQERPSIERISIQGISPEIAIPAF